MKAADIGETPEESSADVARSLQDLRSRSGATYADIAMRIAALRVAAGVSPSAARVARSTVFDAFKADRARLNPALVAEIQFAERTSDGVIRHPTSADSARASCQGADSPRVVASPAVPQPSLSSSRASASCGRGTTAGGVHSLEHACLSAYKRPGSP